MKHLKRKAFVASNVGRAAVATGLSLSMLAGSLLHYLRFLLLLMYLRANFLSMLHLLKSMLKVKI